MILTERVSLIHIMSCSLRGTKKLSSPRPFPSHSSSSIPKCLPHRMILTENSIRKRTHYWLSTLYLKLVLTTSCGENTYLVRGVASPACSIVWIAIWAQRSGRGRGRYLERWRIQTVEMRGRNGMGTSPFYCL